MKIHLNEATDSYFIRACEDSAVIIGDSRYERSLIVSAKTIVADWSPTGLVDLTETAFQAVIDLSVPGSVILLGAGQRSPLVQPQWQQPFVKHQLALEVMSLRAACRTYNILCGDGRAVVAALIIDNSQTEAIA